MSSNKIDPATGFLDRYGCLQMAADMVAHVRADGQLLSALWLDVDRYKQPAESWKYLNGDKIIAVIAQNLREIVKGRAEIGRVGPDEFVLLAPISTREKAERLAEELIHAIESVTKIGDVDFRLSASIGIAILEPGDVSFSFLERADRAKQQAKKQGLNRYVVSDEGLETGNDGTFLAREQLVFEYVLFSAMETGGMRLNYLPTVGFDGNVLAVEVMMSCSVNGKTIPADKFMPVAEKTGLIARLGDWSFLEAARQARHMMDAGFRTRVAVNVSHAQLLDKNFSQTLHAALILANIPPELMELELTESLFMDKSIMAQANLQSARDCGVGLVIDGFGFGSSSILNLKDIFADKLKLDRFFVNMLPHDRRAMFIAKAIVQLGKDLGMTVVAAGVEKKEQIDILRELGVEGIQGYYYAKPMEVDELFSWFKESKRI